MSKRYAFALSFTRSHYPDRASALDFKDTATPQFDHGDAVLVYFYEKVPPVSHQQKYLINGLYNTFDIKSNYIGPVIAKKGLKNWIRG